FAKLLEFDPRFVHFGLHAAPAASWYLNEKLAGDRAAIRTINNEEFAAWLLELHAAYVQDGDDAAALREMRQGTDDTLSRIVASFRETFGRWKSISAHGNFLTAEFIKARERHPEVGVLQPYFLTQDYLAKWGVARFGFDLELTLLGTDDVPFPRFLREGDPEAVRRRAYRGRVSHGAGFVALLHPASWTWRHNAAFFLSEEQAAAEALGLPPT